MNHRRQLAAALACAMAVGLCAGHVFADGASDPVEIVDTPEIISPAPPLVDTTPSITMENNDAPDTVDPTLTQNAGTAALAQGTPVIVEREPGSPDIPLSELDDNAGTVSFESLSPRMLKKNLNILSLDATIDSIAAVDYDELEDTLEDALDLLRYQQNQMSQMIRGTSGAIDGLQSALDAQGTGIDITGFEAILTAYPQSAIASLAGQMASIEDTLDDIEDGVMSEQSNNAIHQLKNAKNQIVMGGETLYISLLGLEQTTQGLQRQLNALDRTVAELELRYEMGQISALTLAEVKAGRTSLISGMQTLEMNVTNLKRQLEAMLGLEITGQLQLMPLTAVTDSQLNTMDYDSDLASVKENSYEIYAAKQSLSTAEEDLDDLDLKTAADYEFDSAEYAVDAAELTLKATQQSVELKFAALYDLIHDQKQVLNAARTSLAVKQDSYAAAQLKYSQGTISKNALLDAEDALSEAQTAVDTAAIDLFTSYNNYRWAVEHGILN